MAVNTEIKKHAKFSASGASRWLACPGSIQLSEKAPPSRSSHYADEGTEAHGVLEEVLKEHIAGGKPFTRARKLSEKHSTEMMGHVLSSYKQIVSLIPDGATVLSETKVDLSFIQPGMFGTVDCAIVEFFGTLTVIDFKYGAGIPVSPENNPQLIYYALGIAHLYEFEFSRVKLVVIQPRAEGFKEWTISIDDLYKWVNRFDEGIQLALSKKAPLVAYDAKVHEEDHCRFCPAAVICPELKEKSLKEIQADFDDESGTLALTVIPTKNEVVPNLGRILTACERLETWIGKVREHALHALEKGHSVEGWKLVQKRSTRKWIDKEVTAVEAKKVFGNLAFTTPELLSPAQFEKTVMDIRTEKWMEKRVSDESSGVTIAPESDKREAYNLFQAEFRKLDSGKEDLCDTSKNKTAKKKIKK